MTRGRSVSSRIKGLFAVIALVAMTIATSLFTLPAKAYASTTSMMVMEDDSYPKVDDLAQISQDQFKITFNFLGVNADNKYELQIVKADDYTLMGTAQGRVYLGSSSGTVSSGNTYLNVDASDWNPGAYAIYAKTYGYTKYGWEEFGKNYDTEFGYVCGLFQFNKNLAGTSITLSKGSFAYNGRVQQPKVRLVDGRSLKEGTDYTVSYSNASSMGIGTYQVTVTGMGGYFGTTSTTYKITKAANTIVVKARAGASVKAGKKLAAKKVLTVKKAKGAVTYAKASGNKKITVSKKGVVAVKKGLKPGTYKVKVKVTAAGDATHKSKTVRVVVPIKVK